MTSPGSVVGDERLRLFLALQIPEDVVAAHRGVAGARALRELGRLVPRANMHVTLAFLGSRPARELPAILQALDEAARARACRSSRSFASVRRAASGMLELRDREGTAAPARRERAGAAGRARRLPAAKTVDWLPHVTVLRYRERAAPAPAAAGARRSLPSGVAAFLSRLHPSGARYEVLESFPLNRREPGG